MSVGFLARVATSIVDTEDSSPALARKTVLPSGVIAIEGADAPTAMGAGSLVRVATSIVEIQASSGPELLRKTVLPSGVIAKLSGFSPAAKVMSAGSLLRVATSMVDTYPGAS